MRVYTAILVAGFRPAELSTTMVSSTVIAFYSLASIWLVLKYRMLLSGQLPSWYTVAELMPAVGVGVAIVVVPAVNLHTGDGAWCPDVHFDQVSKAALAAGGLVPLFDARIAWPGTSIVSAGLTACFCARSGCYGYTTVLAGIAIAASMVRLHYCSSAMSRISISTKLD